MMPWIFFLFGLVSMTGQITLLREILAIFHGTEISIGIFYCIWLAGIGLGACFGAWLTKRVERSYGVLFMVSLMGLSLSLVLHIVLIRTLPFVLGVAPAELTPLSGILVAVPAGTLVTSFITGLLFPIGCKAVPEPTDRVVARLYAFEALGGLAGGLLFTFVLLRLFSPLQMVAVTALVISGTAIAYAGRLRGQQGSRSHEISENAVTIPQGSLRVRGYLFGAGALMALGLVLLSPLGRWLSDWSIRVRWDHLHPGLKLLVSQTTPYQLVEVAQLGKQYSLFGDGKIVSSFPDPHSARRLAALIMAQKPDAKRFLVIGGGIGSFLGSLLEYPVERVHVIEPDPQAMTIASRFLSRTEKESLEDPRVSMVIRDGRLYVNRVERGLYDVVVCMVPDPVSCFWNRYYTREFFQAVARSLAERGMLVTGVTSSENFWGSVVASYAGSVYHTLKQVFPCVKGTPGDRTLFFASLETALLSLDPRVLRQRYQSLGIAPFDAVAFDVMFPQPRVAFVENELEQSPALVNTDFAPLSASLAMILWGKFSGNEGLEILDTIRRGGLKVFLIPMLLFLLAEVGFRLRWGPRQGASTRFRVVLAMAALGAAAMGAEIILIYGYQSLFGHVFERIGLIAAVFMIGLAAGARAGEKLLEKVRRKERALVVTLTVFALFCVALPWCLKTVSGGEPWCIETAIGALVLIAGLLTGVGFPLVAATHLDIAQNVGESSGWTDAADHLGAAGGAAVTGALLVPLLGIENACVVLAAVLLVPAALMMLESVLAPLEQRIVLFRRASKASFPYRRSSWALVSAVLAAALWHMLIGVGGSKPTVTFSEDTLRKVSGSEHFVFVEKPYPHYRGKSVDHAGSTVTLSTIPTAGDVRGYGGPINLIVSVSEAGTIQGLALVASRETPAYIRDLDPWLAQFRGRSILQPQSHDVDARTGATITCRAVKQIVTETGTRIAGPLLGIKETAPRADSTFSLTELFTDLKLWAVLVGVVLFVVAYHAQSPRLRVACLMYALITLGLLLNAPFTCLDAAALLRGEIPAPGTWWRNVLFVAVVGISILWGQAFCGFLCPFGALQEFLCVKVLKRRPSFAVEQAGRYTKFVVLAVLSILFLVTDDTVWFRFSPLQHFFGWTMDAWGMALALVALAASVVYFRFWCRYICPAGAFLALFNRIAILRKWAPRPIPGNCDMGVTFREDVDCIHCHRCLFEAKTRQRTTESRTPSHVKCAGNPLFCAKKGVPGPFPKKLS